MLRNKKNNVVKNKEHNQSKERKSYGIKNSVVKNNYWKIYKYIYYIIINFVKNGKIQNMLLLKTNTQEERDGIYINGRYTQHSHQAARKIYDWQVQRRTAKLK